MKRNAHSHIVVVNHRGFSVIELLVVVAIIFVLTAISLPYLSSHKSLYKSEDQSLRIMDLMSEAGQLAMTRRRTFRFEIDLTDNAAKIIDERGSDPDELVKSIPLEPAFEVRMDAKPTGVADPDPPGYNNAEFVVDNIGHERNGTTVTGHTVWAARFRSDGSVVNAANIPTSANIYLWPPVTSGSDTARNLTEIRAITIFGGSGAVRYWKYSGSGFIGY